MMTQVSDDIVTTQQWLRYWRNSLADAGSTLGAISKKAMENSQTIEFEPFRQGNLDGNDKVLQDLFAQESEETRIVRVIVRPIIYKSIIEHGMGDKVRCPEIITPVVCGLWLSRDGYFIPAAPPVIPRDLLQPQADDRFTLADMKELDKLLSKTDIKVWSESEAISLIDIPDRQELSIAWDNYYKLSRELFNIKGVKDILRELFLHDGKASIERVEDKSGAARNIINLYDWLSSSKVESPLLHTYALSSNKQYLPCIDPHQGTYYRLAHPNSQYPLAIAQRDALAQAMVMDIGEILAINGPPGTGKTTFLLSVVASLWVKAALEEAEPPLVIAASTNNQAVTNILEAFSKGFEETDGLFGGRWLPGITSFGGFYPSRSKESEMAKFYQTPLFYRNLESPEYIENSKKFFIECAQNAFLDHSLSRVDTIREKIHQILCVKQRQLSSLLTLWDDIKIAEENLSFSLGAQWDSAWAQRQEALASFEFHKSSNESMVQQWKQHCAAESIWLGVFSIIPVVARRRRYKRELFIEENFTDVVRSLIRPEDDPESVLDEQVKKYTTKINEIQRELKKLQREKHDYEKVKASFESSCQTLGLDIIPDSFDVLDQALDTSLRFELFELTVHYWEARWLEDCDVRKTELAEQSVKGKEKPGLKKVRPRWRRRMMLTPCIVSTLHSLPAHMTYSYYGNDKNYHTNYLVNEIDLLIVDEAGQVAPDIAGASLGLAKRLLSIGDIHQIKPVANQLSTIDVGNLAEQGVISNIKEYESILESGRSVIEGSVMKISQVASRYRYLGSAEPGMYLREHRRCLNPIIDYCNTLCYDGLLIPKRETPAIDARLPAFAYIHVDGQAAAPISGSRINPTEASTIAEWLASQRTSLEESHQKPLEEIVGIVTPFKAQSQLIRQECLEHNIRVGSSDTDMTVGTVHALQGAERAVVIFSAVYSRHSDGQFIDMDPSLLNVAVSRAKDSFIVFGDMDVIGRSPKGSPRHLLGDYLFRNIDNEISFSSKKARPDLLERYIKPRIIIDSEEHDLCIKELLAGSQKWIGMVSPWINLSRIKQVGFFECIEDTIARGVTVTIYTDRHFNTKKANQFDKDMELQFDKCCESLREIGVTVNVVDHVHSKIIMVDEHLLCIGSYNWGSATRSGPYKNMETSMLYSGDLRDEIKVQLDVLDERIV